MANFSPRIDSSQLRYALGGESMYASSEWSARGSAGSAALPPSFSTSAFPAARSVAICLRALGLELLDELAHLGIEWTAPGVQRPPTWVSRPLPAWAQMDRRPHPSWLPHPLRRRARPASRRRAEPLDRDLLGLRRCGRSRRFHPWPPGSPRRTPCAPAACARSGAASVAPARHAPSCCRCRLGWRHRVRCCINPAGTAPGASAASDHWSRLPRRSLHLPWRITCGSWGFSTIRPADLR